MMVSRRGMRYIAMPASAIGGGFMAQGATGEGAATVRLIDAGATSPLRAQAMYHGVADAMTPDAPPVLLLADPQSSFISAGLYQDVMREIDVQSCVNTGTPIIRREIGGPAAVVSDKDTLVHFVLQRHRPEAAFSAAGLLARFAEPLRRTWDSFGLPAEHSAWGGLSLERYRVSGVQVGTAGNSVIVGGVLMHEFDAEVIAQRASVPSDETRTQLRDLVRERLERANRPPDRAAVREALIGHVGEALGWTLQESSLSDDEQAAIERREEQMAQASHVYCGGRRMAQAELRTGRGLNLVDLVHRGSAGLVRLRLLERAGVIEDIDITGEFMAVPSDAVEKLMPRLVGLDRNAPDLATRIHAAMGMLGLQLTGVTAVDLATALRPVVPRVGPDPLDLLFGDDSQME
jgi:lipoate-protein ligase A